jgi:hypothetical protein
MRRGRKYSFSLQIRSFFLKKAFKDKKWKLTADGIAGPGHEFAELRYARLVILEPQLTISRYAIEMNIRILVSSSFYIPRTHV